MSNALSSRRGTDPAGGPKAALDADAVRAAYRRWAGIYDAAFGMISSPGRKRAVALVNSLPGSRVLEVGVGTGLALPLYNADKRITGIDLSAEMLAIARERVAEKRLHNVDGLLELDAEDTGFAEDSYDIAVAMFVASVVPNPRKLLAEMRRVVRPGGHILFINHFAAQRGPRWWVERAMAPASHALGWHPDFFFGAIFSETDMKAAQLTEVPPFGLFTLAHLPN